MELPKKLEAPEYCTWSKESPEAKINELIDYLESQQEGEVRIGENAEELVKNTRNAVLSEVEREVESKRITADEIYNNGGTDGYGEYAQGNNLMIQKVSTIINNLRVK